MIAADAYAILGLNPSCTLADVRRAYRRQAKVLHPDVNKAPGAHEQFIQLREAYEYLVEIKSGKLTTQVYETTVNQSATHTWTEQRREEARDRARHYAGMKYEEFRRSGHDKESDAFELGGGCAHGFLSILISVILLAALPGPLSVLIGLPVSSLLLVLAYQNIKGLVIRTRKEQPVFTGFVIVFMLFCVGLCITLLAYLISEI